MISLLNGSVIFQRHVSEVGLTHIHKSPNIWSVFVSVFHLGTIRSNSTIFIKRSENVQKLMIHAQPAGRLSKSWANGWQEKPAKICKNHIETIETVAVCKTREHMCFFNTKKTQTLTMSTRWGWCLACVYHPIPAGWFSRDVWLPEG